MLYKRFLLTFNILVFLFLLSGHCYSKNKSTNEGEDLKKACISATIKGIKLEIDRNKTWLNNTQDEKRKEQLRKRITQLKAEIAKYKNMAIDAYKLPPKKEMQAWFAGPCRENAILKFSGLSKSGPWYHVTGIHGNNYNAIIPETKYQMTFYLVYPREYWRMESYYIYIDKFKK